MFAMMLKQDLCQQAGYCISVYIRFTCFGAGEAGSKSSVDMIEEDEPVCPPHNPYYYQGVTLKIDFDPCEEMVEFNLPIPMEITNIITENLISYRLYAL